MNRDELRSALDLDAALTPTDASHLSISTSEKSSPSITSATALVVDEWGMRRGRELLAEYPQRLNPRTSAEELADFHTAAFDPDPQLSPSCEDSHRRSFVEELLNSPDYQSLHTLTRLDDTSSTLAALSFAEQFHNLEKEEKAHRERDAIDREMAILRAVGRAVRLASAEVEECRETSSALGMGAGMPGSNDPAAIARMFRRVRNDPVLRRICERAGRYRRLAQAQQRRKTRHGFDEVIGVEPSGDLSAILPHELVRLTMPEWELLSLRRLIEHEMLARAYQGHERVACGPIVIAVDESGSMLGEKVETAKALALALAWIARRQRRWCALVAYSGDTGERVLALPPTRWDETVLMDWLDGFIGGGSSIDVPVRELPRMFGELKAPPGRTDVVFVTDGICRIPEEVRSAFIAWKVQSKARLISLIIRTQPGDLEWVSDEVHLVSSLEIGEGGVERVLSL